MREEQGGRDRHGAKWFDGGRCAYGADDFAERHPPRVGHGDDAVRQWLLRGRDNTPRHVVHTDRVLV
jgi:hypothetical protein